MSEFASSSSGSVVTTTRGFCAAIANTARQIISMANSAALSDESSEASGRLLSYVTHGLLPRAALGRLLRCRRLHRRDRDAPRRDDSRRLDLTGRGAPAGRDGTGSRRDRAVERLSESNGPRVRPPERTWPRAPGRPGCRSLPSRARPNAPGGGTLAAVH